MKRLTPLVAFLTGCLFIFSGLIKLNDPVGTEIKLEEYFEVFQTDFAFLRSFWHFLVPYSLWLGIFMSVAEVVLGFQLLVRYRVRAALFYLLGLVLFFTFLTFYSAYFNKVTDCGCFGEAIKLTPWQSFGKDVVLLVALVFLWFGQKYLPMFIKPFMAFSLVLSTAIGSSFLAYYCVNHLPLLDFRNYKVGNNIVKMRQISAPLKYKYIMEKNGKLESFEQYPTDTTYKYKDMIVLNPEAMPKITDFKIWGVQEPDYTEEVLKGKKLLFILADIQKTNTKVFPQLNALSKEAERKGIKPLILTSASEAVFEQYRHQWQLAIPYYFGDKTLLKTMIRSNPGIMLLKDGVVKAQWHYNDMPIIAQLEDLLD